MGKMAAEAAYVAAGTILCLAADVPEGQARGLELLANAPCKVIVVRRDGRFHGWLDSCPHYPGGTPMAWRRDAYLDGSGSYLSCHAHGALFDVASGECLIGPCLGKALTAVPLAVDAADHLVLVKNLDWKELCC